MASNLMIGGGAGDSGEPGHRLRAHYQDNWEGGGFTSEIEEEFSDHVFGGKSDENGALDTIKEEIEGSLFSLDFNGNSPAGGDDVVYVAVWKQSEEETSMDALVWAIKNAVISPSTLVFLIHVFPETKFIPSPLGKLSITQVNREQKDNFLAQETGKRNDFLQRFLQVCTASKVKVDTILIESDAEAKAVLDLIPILNIRKLVLGTTRSNVKRIMSSKKGSGTIDQILQNTPEFCDVKIISQGKEMLELMTSSLASSPCLSPKANDKSPRFSLDHRQNSKANGLSPKFFVEDQEQTSNKGSSVGCGCFKI